MLHVAERKRFYRFLAAQFTYPDQELLALLAGETPAALAKALRELEPPPVLAQEKLLTDLQIAFTGLFINRLGGAPAPPYGSVYLEEDGRLLGPSSRQVGEVCRRLQADEEVHPLYLWGAKALGRFCAVEAAWLAKLG